MERIHYVFMQMIQEHKLIQKAKLIASIRQWMADFSPQEIRPHSQAATPLGVLHQALLSASPYPATLRPPTCLRTAIAT